MVNITTFRDVCTNRRCIRLHCFKRK